MIKKSFIITVLSVLAILGCDTAAQAQQTVGEWNIYPQFDGNVTNIVETGDKVYYLCSKRLYSYDKDSNETYIYSTRNKLSDTDITQIYYNEDAGYLLLAYATGNIDIIDDRSGKIYNMSDIADASVNSLKTINDVFFHDGKIYVSTAFGLVIFDEKGRHVIQSGLYNVNVQSACVVNGHLVIFTGATGIPYALPVTERINDYSKFTVLNPDNNTYVQRAYPFGDNILIMRNGGEINRVIIDWDKKTSYRNQFGVTWTQPVFAHSDGSLSVVGKVDNEAYIIEYDADGKEVSRTRIPDALSGQKITYVNGLGNMWAVDGKGLANYRVEDNGTLTVLSDKSVPTAITCDKVAYIRGSKNGERIYISNLGGTKYKTVGSLSSDGLDIVQRTDVLIDGVPYDAAIFEASASQADSRNNQNKFNSTRMYGGPQRLVVDPNNPDRYYIANFIEGVYVVENNKEIGKFTVENMPTYCFWGGNKAGAMGHDVNFDPQGNLWVGCWIYRGNYSTTSPYNILPAAKLKGDLSKITKDDWIPSKHMGNDVGNKDMGSIFSTHSNMMFTWHGADSNPLGVTDTRGTYANTSDDKFFELSTTKDQDGGVFAPQRWICAAEDKRGRIWFGTTSGPIEITNPARVADADFTFTRLKVPRNDGTNYADYLLESERINDIAVDGLNRKWLATENSGVYLVSENGDKIIANYTTENSDLPSNSVYAIYCDPNSNVVYFGLASGLVSFNSTASPAAEDYSNVYAYPNPVRPDYTGWITITGLMDNSLVKIADSAGHVFFQTRSEGGMVVWDGCNANGDRVKSGVYFVFASQSENDNSSGVVTKILVVN